MSWNWNHETDPLNPEKPHNSPADSHGASGMGPAMRPQQSNAPGESRDARTSNRTSQVGDFAKLLARLGACEDAVVLRIRHLLGREGR